MMLTVVMGGEGESVMFVGGLGVGLMLQSCLVEELLEGDRFGGRVLVGECFGLLGGLLDQFVDG